MSHAFRYCRIARLGNWCYIVWPRLIGSRDYFVLTLGMDGVE